MNAAVENGEACKLICSTFAPLKRNLDGTSSNSFSAVVFKLTLLRVPFNRKNPRLTSSSDSLSHGCSRDSNLRRRKSLTNIAQFSLILYSISNVFTPEPFLAGIALAAVEKTVNESSIFKNPRNEQ